MSAPAASRRQLRLLLVIDLLFWAGAETQLRHLAIGLRRRGHQVTLLAVNDITSHVADLEGAGVELVKLRAGGRLAKLRAMPALIRAARRADLVHCTGWDASLWGRLAAIAARRPVVVTEHTAGRAFQVSRSGASRERLIALHNRLLDRFTAATVVVARSQVELLESEGVRSQSIVHVPNAVPLAELRERAAAPLRGAALGVPEGARVVVQVARFEPQKGQPVTLRAVAQLRERLGDVRAVFAGAGGEEERVRREATDMGADWANFLGSRDDVPALLAMADVAVLPSTAEALPMSLIEAMAVGTPVVATDVGDVRWLLRTVGGGLCVPAGDEAAFVAACERLLAEPGLRGSLAEAGRERAAEFDLPAMAERYEKVFVAAADSAPLPSFFEQPSRSPA